MESRVVGFMNQGNLSVVQLATGDQDTFEYISSSAAIKGGLIKVSEISEGGSVNNLLVVNESGKFVFFMDGDILAGAKQNRVLNTSMLLAPGTKTEVPVSCVEQGRWSRVSPDFSSTDYVAPSSLREAKARMVSASLRRKRGHYADQGGVWDGVTLFQQDSGVHSATSNLSDVYEGKRTDFESLIAGFKVVDGANGLGVYVGSDLVSVDLFNRTDVYAEYFPKLLRGIGLEVASRKQEEKGVAEAEGSFRVLDLLDKVNEAEAEFFPSVGVGQEKRCETAGVSGVELIYETKRIHTAVLKSTTSDRRS